MRKRFIARRGWTVPAYTRVRYIHHLTEVESGPRNEVSRWRATLLWLVRAATHNFFVTDLIVLLYLSKTLPLSLSMKTKRFSVCKVACTYVCVCVCVWASEPVEWVYCSRRWRATSTYTGEGMKFLGGNTRETRCSWELYARTMKNTSARKARLIMLSPRWYRRGYSFGQSFWGKKGGTFWREITASYFSFSFSFLSFFLLSF